MTTTSKDSQQYPGISRRPSNTGASSMVISLMTGPLLVTLMGVRTLATTLEQVGIVSEELFRGVRLPNLQNGPSVEAEAVDLTDNERP